MATTCGSRSLTCRRGAHVTCTLLCLFPHTPLRLPQADYLHFLLHALGMAPAILLGKSNGARLSLVLAAKYPDDVAGLVLLNVTNGTKAAKRLSAERYYTFLDTVASGGSMAVVAREQHFVSLFERNPSNKQRLLSFAPERFMLQMKLWGDSLSRGGDPARYPVLGLPRSLLQRIPHPALCIYVADPSGKDDGMHTPGATQALHACLSGATGPLLLTSDKDTYVRAIEDFAARLKPPTHVPESPSAALLRAPLAVREGMYDQLPNAAEVEQMRAYDARVAEENAAEAERERHALCSFGGLLDGLHVFKRPPQR